MLNFNIHHLNKHLVNAYYTEGIVLDGVGGQRI